MRRKFTGRKSLPILTLLSCLSLPLYAQTGDLIGMVIQTKGRVEVRDATGNVRALTRRSEIFEQDTILVGADGFAQLRMVDDAMISFKANTEFLFETYDFDENPAIFDEVVMSMVRGGFRTISGSIGEADQDTYRVDTPFASIGIRGTFHGASLEGGILYTGTWDGGTTISNEDGSIDLGLGGTFDYSETSNDGEGPQGLLAEPVQLSLENFTPGVVEEEEDPDAGDAGAGSDAAEGDAGADDAPDAGDGQAADGAAGNGGNAPAPAPAEPAPAFNRLGNAGGNAGGDTNNLVVNLPPPPAPAGVLTNNNLVAAVVQQVTGDTGVPDVKVNPVLNSRTPLELPVAGTDKAPPPPPPPPPI